MATELMPADAKRSQPAEPWKACLVISAIGEDDSETRSRADHVLNTYIKPSCEATDYDATRADAHVTDSIRRGIVTALERAPMSVAYLGSPPWNENVIIETGYRIAARLPVVVLVDGGADVNQLPYLLKDKYCVELPREDKETEKKIAATNERIITAICEVESSVSSISIESDLPVAVIHSWQANRGGSLDPKRMIYVRASPAATEIFGKRTGTGMELVGCTMADFLNTLKFRMSKAQYDAFMASQGQARKDVAQGIVHVDVPIRFDRHPIPAYAGRSYLPIITEQYRDPDKHWSSLRVLYLDVTSPVEACRQREVACRQREMDHVNGGKDGNGHTADGDVYSCPPLGGDPRAAAAAKVRPISVFLSHSSQDWPSIAPFLERLTDISTSIIPWVDQDELLGGASFVKKIGEVINSVEVAFIFLGSSGINSFQAEEILSLINEPTRRTQPESPKIVLTPIYLDGYNDDLLPPDFHLLRNKSHVTLADINSEKYLVDFFYKYFPDRFCC